MIDQLLQVLITFVFICLSTFYLLFVNADILTNLQAMSHDTAA